MKSKFIKSVLLTVSLFITAASTSFSQVSVGPEIGFTASGLYDEDADAYAGVNVHGGATVHFQLNHFLAVRPSILFKTGTMQYDSEDKISLTRISIPVPIMYSHVFGNNSTIFAGLGPNFMYNLAGKYKYLGESTDIEFGSGEEDVKRLDIGVQIKGGFQFPVGIALSTFINIGTTNLNNYDDYKLRSLDAFGFSVGYMFGSHSRD